MRDLIARMADEVSIHALLAECDGRRSSHPAHHPRFQSTHSLRSATITKPLNLADRQVSIHALLAECDLRQFAGKNVSIKVSIHALLAECDIADAAVGPSLDSFNPRTPCGVRPVLTVQMTVKDGFQSTHSLRSATINKPSTPTAMPGFNPRTPCGVRPSTRPEKLKQSWFQSTHSLRSATHRKGEAPGQRKVSIHALLAECDSGRSASSPSCAVSIHALLAECDGPC